VRLSRKPGGKKADRGAVRVEGNPLPSRKAVGSGDLVSLIPKPPKLRTFFSSEITMSFDPPVIMAKFGAMSSAMCLPAGSSRDCCSGITGRKGRITPGVHMPPLPARHDRRKNIPPACTLQLAAR
jgi:hypothetical protein